MVTLCIIYTIRERNWPLSIFVNYIYLPKCLIDRIRSRYTARKKQWIQKNKKVYRRGIERRKQATKTKTLSDGRKTTASIFQPAEREAKAHVPANSRTQTTGKQAKQESETPLWNRNFNVCFSPHTESRAAQSRGKPDVWNKTYIYI